jgi:hypothetical protein
MIGGDRWIQSTFTVTGSAKNIWSYGTGEAKDPVDLVIQNTHASAIIYVNLSGTATVSDTMFKIVAGATLTLENIRNDVSVIGSIASNEVPYRYSKGAGR